jgi:hypothetical protein
LAASTGREREAEEKIALAIEKGKGFGHFHHTAYHIACAYALMNRPEQAMEWLRKAADGGFPCYPLFENDESLRSLRSRPDFRSLIDELKRRTERYRSLL